MQAIESQNLILYQTDLRGQWPEAAAQTFARRLPYARRLALRSVSSARRASLAGIALALRTLARVAGHAVEPREIVFARGEKPRLALPGAIDFSISHAGPWVACAALAHGRVGLDVEMGTEARIAHWVVLEAALKASGEGLRALGAARQISVRRERLRWRGKLWQVRRLQGFGGGSACVVCRPEIRAVERCAVPLTELFDA